jgi:hypothetical protein
VQREDSPGTERLRTCAALVRQHSTRWRTGEDVSPTFTTLLHELPQDIVNTVQAVAVGDDEAPEPTRRLASRLHAVLQNAAVLDRMSHAWATASALPEGEPAQPPEACMTTAVYESDAGRAKKNWNAAQDAWGPVAQREAAQACQALGPLVMDDDHRQDALVFLAGTKDLWEDASADMERRAVLPRGTSGSLRHARTLRMLPAEERVPTASARHVARQSVEHLVAAGSLTLKRLAVRAWPHWDGMVVLGADGQPRVGWPERRGAPAALDLVGLTQHAALLALRPQLSSEDACHLLAFAAQLGALMTPVLRQGWNLPRDDASWTQRHGAFVLLRNARVRAALAAQRPATPVEALDAMAAATTSDPDIVEAAAWLAPFPDGSPFTSLRALRPNKNWSAGCAGAQWALAAREQWDEDFLGRPVYQQMLHSLFALRDRVPDPLAEMGLTLDTKGTALRTMLEGWLA